MSGYSATLRLVSLGSALLTRPWQIDRALGYRTILKWLAVALGLCRNLYDAASPLFPQSQ